MTRAHRRARFCIPFMKVGLVPDCRAFYTLPRVIGLARAKEFVFTAREIQAEKAQDTIAAYRARGASVGSGSSAA
ncbi:hypothetical protein CIC12_32095 [Burkholderia sp. SG-MS1]|nr:hypothetical protein [Paraburkholderia sp. SG-MS1]